MATVFADFEVDLLPNRTLSVTFAYDFRAVQIIKTIPGRRWDSKNKRWTIPHSSFKSLQEQAARNGISLNLSKTTEIAFERGKENRSKLDVVKQDETPLNLPTATIPFPFQYTGIRFIQHALRYFQGVLLCDDMGLGKTFQSLSLVAISEKLSSVLVVVPATLKLNWALEIDKHYPDMTYTVIGSAWRPKLQRWVQVGPKERAKQWAEPTLIKICNYELIVKDVEPRVRTWDIVIADEVGAYLKNYRAQRTKRVKALKRRYTLGVSGLPLENRLEELWSVMDFCIPNLLGPGWLFKQQHVVTDRYGTTLGYRGLEEVRERIGPYYIRRRKEDVLTELPEKSYTDMSLELSKNEWAIYDAIVMQIKENIAENPKLSVLNILTEMLRLKQLLGSAELVGEEDVKSTKRKALHDIVDEAEGQNIVAFTEFKELAYLLQEEYNCPVIHGDIPKEKRMLIVEEFQKGKQKLLVSTDAGAYGITLTSASIVVHVDQPWNPAKLRQREDRTHRIGQRNAVQVITLKAVRTIDEHISEILYNKSKLIEAVLDEKMPDTDKMTLTKSDILGLLGGGGDE